MAKDKVFEKQLAAFGIEATVAVEPDPAKRVKEEQRQSYTSTIKNIMSTMEGRQWVHEKLDVARVFTAPFAPGQPDVSAFLSGIQAFGQMLLAEVIAFAPEEFYLMNQEAAARKAALKSESRKD